MSLVSDPERFITDSAGNRTAVILDIDQYEMLLEALEELDEIRAYDEATSSTDEVIPFDLAIQEIEQART